MIYRSYMLHDQLRTVSPSVLERKQSLKYIQRLKTNLILNLGAYIGENCLKSSMVIRTLHARIVISSLVGPLPGSRILSVSPSQFHTDERSLGHVTAD